MATWEEIKKAVEDNGNVKTFTMGQLRDAQGVDRLGVNVLTAISSKLAGMGLGHVPEELPGYQDNLVRVFKRGTPVGDVITTVLTPGSQNDSKLVDGFGRDGMDYAAIVQQIRELVAE